MYGRDCWWYFQTMMSRWLMKFLCPGVLCGHYWLRKPITGNCSREKSCHVESNHNKYIANTFINKQIQRSGNYDIRQNKPRKVFLCYVCVCGDSMSSQGLGDSSYLSFSIECNKRMYCNRFGAFHFNFQQIKSLRRDLWYIREIESFEQKCTLYQRVKPFKRFMI